MSPLAVVAALASILTALLVLWLIYFIERFDTGLARYLEGMRRELIDINQTLKVVTRRGDLERIEREIAAWERRRDEEREAKLQAYVTDPQSPPTPPTPSTAITSPAAMSRAVVLGRWAAMIWRWFKRERR